jgi:hypothetical protein
MAKQKDWGSWEEVDRSENYSLIWASEGVGGSGKTHFGLTAPEPIAVHLFDPGGLTGLTKNALFKKKDIRVLKYNITLGNYDEDDRSKAATDALAQFKENQEVALRNARTILWDKEDHVWELLRWARLGGISDKPPSYYELNLEYRSFFHEAEMAGVNLGVIRGMKEKWGKTGANKEGRATFGGLGELEPRGQKEVPELVQVVLRHRWDKDVSDFVATVHEKCRVGDAKALIGTEHIGLTFPELGKLIYPETEDLEGVWE